MSNVTARYQRPLRKERARGRLRLEPKIVRLPGIHVECGCIPKERATGSDCRWNAHVVNPRSVRLIEIQFSLRVRVAHDVKVVVDGQVNVLGVEVEPKLAPAEIARLRRGDSLHGITRADWIRRFDPQTIEPIANDLVQSRS